jgi:hypothetical protein
MSKNKGGHPVDDFVHKHFTFIGGKMASKQWNMCCNYCPANTTQLIVHPDSRCTHTLQKLEKGPAYMHPQRSEKKHEGS